MPFQLISQVNRRYIPHILKFSKFFHVFVYKYYLNILLYLYFNLLGIVFIHILFYRQTIYTSQPLKMAKKGGTNLAFKEKSHNYNFHDEILHF